MTRTTKTLILVLILITTLSACSTPPPDETATKFLDALKAMNSEEMVKYVAGGESSIGSELTTDDPTGAEILKTVFGKLTYEVGKGVVTGDMASVPVSITCVDMVSVTSDVVSKSIGMAFTAAFGGEDSGEDMQAIFEQMFENALKDPNAPMTTTSVDLELKKTGGKWLIVFNDETSTDFLNAVTGGLGTIAEAFSQTGE